ncbi:alanine racemase [soil metagenome]
MRHAHVDLGAVSRNVQLLRAAVAPATTMAVVKANAYGHGAVPVARAALEGGADWLGVVDLDEALELRAAGVTASVFSWLHDPATDFEVAVGHGIDVGVSYLDQLERAAAASGRPVVHLKVDTGLGRNGIAPVDWPAFFAAAAAHERAGRVVVRGLWTHLAGANDAAQLASFEEARAAAAAAGLEPELFHAGATGAALAGPDARLDLVRLGIGIYGISPFSGEGDGRDAAALGLTPAMTLSGTVVSAKRVAAGTGVSYGHDYVTERETTLALVPLGYADGIPRHASSRGPVSINGTTYRIAGRVAMDQFVLDVGDDRVSVGDRAVLFGDPATGVPSVDDWAAAAGTINYEIVTRIGNRVKRSYS